jgi:hypothetical protein
MRRGIGIWRGLAMVGIVAASVGGCAAPYPNVLVDSNGNQIRLSDIDQILSQTDLNEDQKKAALEALGITDPELLNVLLTLAPST